MPMRRSAYSPHWPEVSKRIRERAGQRCEWCGAANGSFVLRDSAGKPITVSPEHVAGLDGDSFKPTKIILTCAHLGVPHKGGRPGNKHDKHDIRDENLAALCQYCHLTYDREDHIRNAAETRRRKKLRQGQQELLATEPIPKCD